MIRGTSIFVFGRYAEVHSTLGRVNGGNNNVDEIDPITMKFVNLLCDPMSIF